MKNKRCSICHAELTCGSPREGKACWCADLPMIMPADFSQDCRCRECLVHALVERIEGSIKTHSHDAMVNLSSQYRNNGELTERIDYNLENGNTVFTQWYHLKRGVCCGNGCKNCPYPE